jgi:hypothetical protein
LTDTEAFDNLNIFAKKMNTMSITNLNAMYLFHFWVETTTVRQGLISILVRLQADIKVIVDKHNELRRKVAKGLEARGVGGGQPKAADMNELVWDPVLAASAQRSVATPILI